MLAAYFEDQRAGNVQPANRYLEIFSHAHEAGSSRSDSAAEITREAASLERVGAYEIERRLGQGGQGMVFLARDVRLNRRVALKVLPAAGPGTNLLLQRLRREAAITSRLDHEAICPVYETGTESGMAYIAMRFVEGESLAFHLARSREEVTARNHGSVVLPESASPETKPEMKRESVTPPATGLHRRRIDAILALIEATARALHAAHEAGIVHRDVKPGNIMVAPDGRPVLLDFGLARDEVSEDLETLTRPGDVFGTPAYMSPEQVVRKDRLDRRTDIWSLGVTLYECLALERPFQATTRHDLSRAILEREPDFSRRRRNFSRDLTSILRAALEKDRERRYQTALDFAEDLRRVRERRPIAARPAGPLLRLARWAQRNPLLAAAVFGIFLALAGGLATTLLQKAQTDQALWDYDSLADGIRARKLLGEVDDLWPAHPSRLSRIEKWLTNAHSLVRARSGHASRLRELESAGTGAAFETRRHLLSLMLDDLETLDGRIPEIEARRETARTLAARSIEDDHATTWAAAIRSAANDRRYFGLDLKPIIGLCPLGTDLSSGLLEFAHLLTGDSPERDPDGRLRLTEASGIVLVLVPGGRFIFGTGPEIPASVFRKHLLPATPVHADPFLISKYEMTQAQWFRATGANPSHYPPVEGSSVTLLHPVENVSRDSCRGVLARLDLELPSEVQWERAARAGTNTVWWTGDDPSGAEKADNFSDRSRNRAFPTDVGSFFDDGHIFHAPVDAFPPNPFGLHSVIGNVSEWCSDDVWEDWPSKVEVPGSARPRCVYRGGNFLMPIDRGCSAFRVPAGEQTFNHLGVRPARSLAP
jgi:serine/threonine protein kinase/formylglycine-generating enzyme required for sulfatase activity